MDFSWWLPIHTGQLLNLITLLFLAWGIGKLLKSMKRVEDAVTKLYRDSN